MPNRKHEWTAAKAGYEFCPHCGCRRREVVTNGSLKLEYRDGRGNVTTCKFKGPRPECVSRMTTAEAVVVRNFERALARESEREAERREAGGFNG